MIQVRCANLGLERIPSNLKTEIQVREFTWNVVPFFSFYTSRSDRILFLFLSLSLPRPDPGRVGEQGTSVDERQPGPVHEPRLPLPEGQFYPGNSRGGFRQPPIPEDARPLDERVRHPAQKSLPFTVSSKFVSIEEQIGRRAVRTSGC